MAGDEGAVRESAVAVPARPLRGLVASYQGFREAGVPPGRHLGLPSPYLTLIFTLDDLLTVASNLGPHTPPVSYRTLVGGLHTTPVLVTHDGRQSGIQISVSPLGARALFGLPAGELAGATVAAVDVLGTAAGELHERIRAAGSWPERFAVCDRLLAARAAPRTAAPEVAQAWRLIVSSGGTVGVGALASETGWSSRHLRSRFLTETGLTPKAACRVTRFHRARRLLQRRATACAPLDLAGLAARTGFYDQAHLAREFRDLAGCPPSAWLAAEGLTGSDSSKPARPPHENNGAHD
jgi:AraC-like DNA-binding protein